MSEVIQVQTKSIACEMWNNQDKGFFSSKTFKLEKDFSKEAFIKYWSIFTVITVYMFDTAFFVLMKLKSIYF